MSRLYHKRPALEKERFEVLRVVDSAKYITPDLREEIHRHYGRELNHVNEDISGMEANLKRLKGGGSDVS